MISSIFNRIAVWLQKSDVKGKYLAYRVGKKLFGQYLIEHRINGSSFWVPWDQWCFWLNNGPENYYLEETMPFLRLISEQSGPVAFLDLGADVGIMSKLAESECNNVSLILAIEPNPASFKILEKNLGQIEISNVGINKAISNYIGRAEFNFSNELSSDHEGYMTARNQGNTEVSTLDKIFDKYQLHQFECITIKIDVEGQEKCLAQGAHQLLSSTESCILLLEIHPEVMHREHQTPECLFEEFEKHRSFKWLLPSKENQEVDRTRAFFSQVPEKQYDVIGISNSLR